MDTKLRQIWLLMMFHFLSTNSSVQHCLGMERCEGIALKNVTIVDVCHLILDSILVLTCVELLIKQAVVHGAERSI